MIPFEETNFYVLIPCDGTRIIRDVIYTNCSSSSPNENRKWMPPIEVTSPNPIC